MNQFYVYILIDQHGPAKIELPEMCLLYEPFYVGKGKGNRAYQHIKESLNWTKKVNKLKCSKINKILNDHGCLPEVMFYKKNLDEIISINVEEHLIELIGTKINKNGSLTNIRNKTWSCGPIPNNETKRKTNGLIGKRRKTVRIGDETHQIEVERLSDLYYTERHQPRSTKQLNKQRNGQNNGRYGTISSSKNKKWVIIDNQSFLLTIEEIDSLNCHFIYGRIVDNKNRIRVIFKGDDFARYVNRDFSDIPQGVEYQLGLVWNHKKQIYKKE